MLSVEAGVTVLSPYKKSVSCCESVNVWSSNGVSCHIHCPRFHLTSGSVLCWDQSRLTWVPCPTKKSWALNFWTDPAPHIRSNTTYSSTRIPLTSPRRMTSIIDKCTSACGLALLTDVAVDYTKCILR